MSKEFSSEIIEQYLNKQLTGETLAEFETRMGSDPEFKKEVELLALLHRGANKVGADDMRATLKRIRTEVLEEENTATQENQKESAKVLPIGQSKKPRSFLKWSIAATIAIAIGAALFLFENNDPLSSSELYASYYEPFSEEINTRNTTVESIIKQASQFYKDKNYAAALLLFTQALAAEPDNAEIQLATGICYLELNQFDNAIQAFSAVNNPLFKEQARWYLAMTFLKKKEVEKARVILETIKNGSFKHKEAKEILTGLGD